MRKFVRNPIYMAAAGLFVGMLSREFGAVFFESLNAVLFSMAVFAEVLGSL